jgi:hypothetical protein
VKRGERKERNKLERAKPGEEKWKEREREKKLG